MTQRIERTIIIAATSRIVWRALTEPELMLRWMGEPGMDLSIETEWRIGGPIVIAGVHHERFRNQGTVVCFEPHEKLRYDYLSSISALPDTPENHTSIEFLLSPVESGTLLTLVLSNFPTEAIYRHVDFYWRGTLAILKRVAETAPPQEPSYQ